MREPGKPEPIGDALKSFFKERGLDERVDQASIVIEWPSLVGAQIAGVTAARMVTEDGVLFVGVKTHAWMSELALMERTLLAKINARQGRAPIQRIRWELLR